jgi:type IV secretion system protein VirD4
MFVLQLWPLALAWWAWAVASDLSRTLPPVVIGDAVAWIAPPTSDLWSYAYQLEAGIQPLGALLGPTAVMAAAIMLSRIGIGRHAMALAGVVGLAGAAVLTGWPDYLHALAQLLGTEQPSGVVGTVFDTSHALAIFLGLGFAFAGYCIATQVRPGGNASDPSLQRGTSDNFGHADWLSMEAARQRFPGPGPAYGGLVVGEAYRVDQDPAARGTLFDPANPRTWGVGGKPPLLIDPCRVGSTHGLVFAGSGGFKTTSMGIPTLMTWTGSAVVLDPAREIGPMVGEYRRQSLGHAVVSLDPATAKQAGINVLDWIDIASDRADSDVEAVVDWITHEPREDTSASSAFFKGSGRDVITCLLADMLWDPDLPPAQKTLRTFQRRLVTPENEMRDRLAAIHQYSASPKARDVAGTLMRLADETFSGIYGNANRDARWLSTPAYADLVSGGAESSLPAMRTGDLVGGRTTVFLQIPLPVLQATPALARVLVGALLNAAYQADGRVAGRVLFLLDEVARLGYMHLLEQARDAGRKYGITMLLLYQSLAQLAQQWGREGKQAWFDNTSWQLFAAVQHWDTARELSAMCGEYAVVATSAGDSTSSQSGRTGASSSAGRSENRSEIKRALIKPEELMHDARWDEAFVLAGGTKPLRCGRAIYFRRPEWKGLVEKNRFHRQKLAAD